MKQLSNPPLNKIFLGSILFTFTFGLQVQQYVDFGKIFYINMPVNQLDTLTNGTHAEEFGIDLNLPVPLKGAYLDLT